MATTDDQLAPTTTARRYEVRVWCERNDDEHTYSLGQRNPAYSADRIFALLWWSYVSEHHRDWWVRLPDDATKSAMTFTLVRREPPDRVEHWAIRGAAEQDMTYAVLLDGEQLSQEAIGALTVSEADGNVYELRAVLRGAVGTP